MSALMLTLLLAPAEGSASNADLFRRGEEAYEAGMDQRARGDSANRGEMHFREAAQRWEQIRAGGIDNALLYRDLGHAYFLGGDLPRAILNYRLGLRREPGDVELRKGLAQARAQVVFREGSPLGRPAEEVRPIWLPEVSIGWLFGLSVAMYLAGWACLMRWLMVRRSRLLVAGLALVVVGLWPGWLVFDRQRSGPASPIVVIARDGVLLRKGNGTHFPAWSEVTLDRGVEAEQILSREGWRQVRLAGGEVGWVRSAEVVIGDDPETSP